MTRLHPRAQSERLQWWFPRAVHAFAHVSSGPRGGDSAWQAATHTVAASKTQDKTHDWHARTSAFTLRTGCTAPSPLRQLPGTG